MDTSKTASGTVAPVSNLLEFFREELAKALVHQKVALEEHTSFYVANLLALYSRTEVSHGDMRPGQRWVSLAELLAQAGAAATTRERESLLQRLGDVSLFVAGFFPHGFERRLVDIDYHIAMGGRAYGTLASAPLRGPRHALCTVFAELSRKFQSVVDAISDISDSARLWSTQDVLRLYEMWIKTGSRRSHSRLHELGVAPVQASLQLN